MKESALSRKILEELKKIGWAVKFHGSQFAERGVPDILACVEGRFFAVEVKSTAGRTTKIQRYQIRKIINAGGTVIVARSLDEVLEEIKKLTKA